MRSARLALLAFFACGLLLGAVVPQGTAQGDPGHLIVQTDYELIGLSQLSGGGHVTWTLTGEQARALRAKIVGLFDTYDSVPRGFPFGGTTAANHDGTIDASEGLAYTDRLERVLERGTQVGYFYSDRSDLFDTDPQGGLARSTTGLIGTDPNDTGDLQIRFLFNGWSSLSDTVMQLPTRVFADALEDVFSFDDAQSPTLNPVNPYPLAWPITLSDAWHKVSAYGQWALSVQNDTTGFYENNTRSVMVAYNNTSLGPWLDLRFGTSAWVTFNYTGRVADAGDSLRLQVATEPLFSNWQDLSYAGQTALPNTTPALWINASMDLSAYLGERVRFRFVFTSDGLGSAPGFFVRNFAVHSPSKFQGTIVQSDAHYLIGTLSFSDYSVVSGGITEIRTPGGEILLYTSGWANDSRPPDYLRFAIFNALENPQVLFVVMVAGAYFISRLQELAYDAYREAHPGVFRPAVRKVKWLHWLGRATIVLLVLFYFIPTALYWIGLRLFISGPLYLFLILGLALSLGLGTRAYYQQLLEESPPPEVAATQRPTPTPETAMPAEEKPPVGHCTHCLREIPASDRVYRCSCGAMYHLSCASGLMKCTDCRKPISLEVVRKKVSVSMRCESCGEVQTIPEGVDPRTVLCASCGGRLRRLDAGKAYLLVASNPAIAFGWLKDLTKGGKPSLVLTTATPERLRLEFGLKGSELVQVSSSGPNAIDPKKLDPAGLKVILPLSRSEQGGVLLYDGLEQMINESSVGEIVRFLRKANDMAFVHSVTVIARVTPGILDPSELKRLASEFDEEMDLTAQM